MGGLPKGLPKTISPKLTELLFDYIFTWSEAEETSPVTLSDAVYTIKYGKHDSEVPVELKASPKLVKDVRELLSQVKSRYPSGEVKLYRAESSTRLPGQKIASWSNSRKFTEEYRGRKIQTKSIPVENIVADPEVTSKYSPDRPKDTEFIVWEG
jgi:hypothetical protein